MLEPGAEASCSSARRPSSSRRKRRRGPDVMEAVPVVVAATSGRTRPRRTSALSRESRPAISSGGEARAAHHARSLARDGGAFGQRPLGRVETLESAGEQRLDVGGTDPSAPGTGLPDEREELLQEKRVPPANPTISALAASPRAPAATSSTRTPACSWPAAPGRGTRSSRPIRAAPREFSPCETNHEERCLGWP